MPTKQNKTTKATKNEHTFFNVHAIPSPGSRVKHQGKVDFHNTRQEVYIAMPKVKRLWTFSIKEKTIKGDLEH